MRRVAAWVVLGAISLGSFVASGQTKLPGKVPGPTGLKLRTVSGVVKSAIDRPVPNAVVSVWDEDGATDQKMGGARSDQYGRFRVTYVAKSWDPVVASQMGSANPDIYVTATAPGQSLRSRTFQNNASSRLYAFVSSSGMRTYVGSLDVTNAKASALDTAMANLVAASGKAIPQRLLAAKSAARSVTNYYNAHRYPGGDAGTKKIDSAFATALNQMLSQVNALTNKPSSWRGLGANVYVQGAKFNIQSIAASCAPGSSGIDGCNCLDQSSATLRSCQPFMDAWSG